MIDRLGKDDVFLPVLVDEGDSPGNDWAIGFLRGMELSRSEWLDLLEDEENGGSTIAIMALANEHNPDPELRPYKESIAPEQREQLLIGMSAGVMNIFKYFSEFRKFNARAAKQSGVVRRDTPKVGRNSPCPCGSGKKYKKCCAQMLEH